MAVMRGLRRALLLTLACSFAGCASFQGYPGAARQQDEIAIVTVTYVQGFWILGGASLTFRSLDGIPIPRTNSEGRLITEIGLEQGEHDIGFDYKACMFGAYAMNVCGPLKTGSLRFTAVRGHRYHLDAAARGDRLWAWIIDDASDQIVVGQRPP
jgi:hypothetical protein